MGLEWDTEQLLIDLNAGVDLSGMFRDDELDELLAGMQGAGMRSRMWSRRLTTPKLRAKWGVESGQMWQMGEHRIVCGGFKLGWGHQSLDERRPCIAGVYRSPMAWQSAQKPSVKFRPEAGWNLTDIEDDSLSPTELKAQLLPVFNNIRALVMAEDCTVFVTPRRVANHDDDDDGGAKLRVRRPHLEEESTHL